MKQFADLFSTMDQTTKTNAKVDALAQYFVNASDDDKLWTIALLSGRRPKRAITTTHLREWAAEEAGIPHWLFEECYPIVGDLAETIALILPEGRGGSNMSLTDWITKIMSLKDASEDIRKAEILKAWRHLNATERFLFNKLITGGFRIGVSQKLMTRALSKATGIDESALAHRIMGDWTPDTTDFENLILAPDPLADLSKPYPFYLAYGLENAPETLGAPEEWFAEHKWDGIRGQLVIRGGQYFLWSRGEELISDRFPEFAIVPDFVEDGTVIDGEVLTWKDEAPLPFQTLQTRIGRKTVSKQMLSKAPVILKAYDLLEWQGVDWRDRRYAERRHKLEDLVVGLPDQVPLQLSETVQFDDWDALATERDTARDIGSEGIMLKRRDSPYLIGRKKGDWWKWKVDPLSVDAVMTYAQQGHGRRANLFTDFTFAVPDEDGELVTFTKAYSGLTDAEFREITAWVRKNTLEKYGPVRRVPPVHVFEIHFEGIQKSSRHKSGLALRFPRMSRWRKDKPLSEINTLSDLQTLLETHGS